IATHFRVNDKDYLVPMAIEEPSVVAAASNAAKVARSTGGFRALMTPPVMIGQIQVLDVVDPWGARLRILGERDRLLAMANAKDPMLVKFGGGARDLEIRVLESPRGALLVVHLLVDARDAGGMNAVNTMCEALAPEVARLAGGRVVLRIISNLAVLRLARASAVFPAASLATENAKGPEVVEAILDAYTLALVDPFRCATHNKGIMNGISSVVVATGNDFRAIESGAHTYAAFTAKDGAVVRPLTTYEKNRDGDLVGTIELPVAVGLIGGATAVHPTAKANVKLLRLQGASELAGLLASVGLAQNFSALRALATEGIQRGHMELHARNIAATAGAKPEEVDRIVARMISDHTIRVDRAKELLAELRGATSP
ncbi:MAG: hydroxymethylglutaryl-CoA reductase, degradative, partial [Thermoplasmata archaeon]|nr:hydroxymethylglutaryl-CoA reductase, degradative [Thermoplasmata archaeon]